MRFVYIYIFSVQNAHKEHLERVARRDVIVTKVLIVITWPEGVWLIVLLGEEEETVRKVCYLIHSLLITVFQTFSCCLVCRSGTWGSGCSNLCYCASGSVCDAENGVCICQAGKTGLSCEEGAWWWIAFFYLYCNDWNV